VQRTVSGTQRIAMYLRVSKQDQVDGFSLDAQKRAMEHYCKAHDGKYEIVEEYRDEGMSAKFDDIDKRPVFREAIEAIERGRVDAIMVHKLDRFARNLLLALTTLERIDYRLVCLNPSVDFTDSMGRMQAHILMSFNQFYSDNLADEVKKGLYERREQGLWLGHLAFGAVAQSTEGGGKLPPVADRECVVVDRDGREWSRYDALRHVFARASAGISLARISGEMHDIGFPLSESTIHYMLKNRFYLGELPVKGSNKNHVEQWVPGTHAPLIDESLFQAVADNLQKNKRGSAKVRARAHVYPLTGMCRCGQCESTLHCDTSKGKARLHCSRARRQRSCTQPIVQQRKIEAEVLAHLTCLQVPSARIPTLVASLRQDTPDVDAQRERLRRRKQKLRTLYLHRDEMTLPEYEAECAEIDRQLILLEPVEQSAEVMQELACYLSNFSQWWDDASDAERNTMLSHVLSTVVVDNGSVTALGFVPQADQLLRSARATSTSGSDISSRPAFAAA
jgi:site-specific DNA recombinase